jgi:hypothetical protein
LYVTTKYRPAHYYTAIIYVWKEALDQGRWEGRT